MSKLPALSGKDVLKALLKAGFYVHRTSSSHYVLKHPAKPALRPVVPVHGKRSLKPKTLSSILKQADMSVGELRELL
jgi:predicted RNA binding protein YcfA (HicA-like mRNA interferase family)